MISVFEHKEVAEQRQSASNAVSFRLTTDVEINDSQLMQNNVSHNICFWLVNV